MTLMWKASGQRRHGKVWSVCMHTQFLKLAKSRDRDSYACGPYHLLRVVSAILIPITEILGVPKSGKELGVMDHPSGLQNGCKS